MDYCSLLGYPELEFDEVLLVTPVITRSMVTSIKHHLSLGLEGCHTTPSFLFGEVLPP